MKNGEKFALSKLEDHESHELTRMIFNVNDRVMNR